MRGAILGAALLLFCARTAAAQNGTGYDPDYDYPGQGDDWYGRRSRPDPRQDFPSILMYQILSGEDFCRGYERAFDPVGWGAPLFRTNGRHDAHAFRFSPADAGWPCLTGYAVPTCEDGNPCTNRVFDLASATCVSINLPNGTSCADSAFCNGNETCFAGTCMAGPAPNCDDGNVCTSDMCSTLANSCVSNPVPVSVEVVNLLADVAEPGSTRMLLMWDRAPGADDYNVYIGIDGAIGAFNCYQAAVGGNSTLDMGEVPPQGAAWLYLVTATNCAGEAILGTDSAEQERRNFNPCR